MITVYKYSIPRRDRDSHPHEDLLLPEGAKILYVGEMDGFLYLWAEVVTSKSPVKRRIYLIGSGRPVRFECKYVCTVLTSVGYVWHVYEE